jgi:two-component system phosphate regulon sensor histidine kinase PhoR
VREAVEAFGPVARSRHVVIQTALEPDIVCIADPGALRQILLNLLDNAVKYGPIGQTVTITLRRAGHHARMTVDDQGPGIPPEHRDRIWQPYQRLESAVSAAVAGSGIGRAARRAARWPRVGGGGTRKGSAIHCRTAGNRESGIGNRGVAIKPE